MARMLYRLRGILLLAGIAAGVWLAVVIASPSTASVNALLPISLMLWVALGLGVGYTLPNLPPGIAPNDGIRLRLRKRIGQLGYWLALAVMLALSAFALYSTARAFNLVID